MRFTEEELRQAAIRVQNKQLLQAQKDDYQPSPQFEQRLQTFMTQVKQGKIVPRRPAMGWQYYVGRGAAVLLLCFVLTCAAMPDVVMAGVQKVIETVETIFEEYTQFLYTSHADNDTIFMPLSLEYLPEGLVEVEREQDETSLDVLYMDEERYLIINQKLLQNIDQKTYILDTEDAQTDIIQVRGNRIVFSRKNNLNSFTWTEDNYILFIDSNLNQEELYKIIEKLKVV